MEALKSRVRTTTNDAETKEIMEEERARWFEFGYFAWLGKRVEDYVQRDGQTD